MALLMAGAIGLLVGASLLGKPLPLSAVQILYVNLATDGLPALEHAVDIGIADGTSVIPAVGQGIPIRYVATMYALFPNIVMAAADSGCAERDAKNQRRSDGQQAKHEGPVHHRRTGQRLEQCGKRTLYAA